MANKLINQMGLPKSIDNFFTARNITMAKEALSLTEFELMEVLDVNLAYVTSAVARISEITWPPYQTVLILMEQRVQKEHNSGHLSTPLKGLDDALCVGIPFGVLTELVGPAGIGKTQYCLKLAFLASLPEADGGLDGRVIYVDVESKFSSRRMIEIESKSFPEVFHTKGMAQEMAGRILVMQPTSLSEFTEREQGQGAPRRHLLGWHISFINEDLKVVMKPTSILFKCRALHDHTEYDSHLVAALGIHWAHAVTIRLVLDSKSGKKFIKLAKSLISLPLAPSVST